MLARIDRREVDVVVWHIGRLTRSMLDLEQLITLAENRGVGVATVTGDIDLTNDVGQMVARIPAAVARAEVQRKAACQKSANRLRTTEGKPHAHLRPFGYEEDRVTLREDEARAYRKAAQDVLAGKPISVVTREWIAAGFVSSMAKEGGPPRGARGVRNAFVSPRYAGIRFLETTRLRLPLLRAELDDFASKVAQQLAARDDLRLRAARVAPRNDGTFAGAHRFRVHAGRRGEMWDWGVRLDRVGGSAATYDERGRPYGETSERWRWRRSSGDYLWYYAEQPGRSRFRLPRE